MPNRDMLEVLENIGFFNIPIDQKLLYNTVVAAQSRGYLVSDFQRLVIAMPFGATTTQTITVPQGRVYKYIGIDNVMSDIHDALITVTLTIDSTYTVYDSVPLTRDINANSVYFPFIFDTIEHTLVNGGAANAEFTEDVQLLDIDKGFFDEILSPIFEGEYEAVKDFAQRVGGR